MGLPAMARIMRIPEERLRALSETSPVFAPGASNYLRTGAIDALWSDDLAARLLESLDRADTTDRRSASGFDRGGRLLAQQVAKRVAVAGLLAASPAVIAHPVTLRRMVRRRTLQVARRYN